MVSMSCQPFSIKTFLQNLCTRVINELKIEVNSQPTPYEREHEVESLLPTSISIATSDTNSSTSSPSASLTPLVLYSSYASSLGSPEFSMPPSVYRSKGSNSGIVSENGHRIKTRVLQNLLDVLERYVAISQKYEQQSSQIAELPLEDYKCLERILDDLGRINDLAVRKRPHLRGCIHVFGAARITWVKMVFTRRVKRWGVPLNLTLRKSFAGVQALGQEDNGDFAASWRRCEKNIQEEVVNAMMWRIFLIIMETVCFLAERDVDILPQYEGTFEGLIKGP